MAGAAGEGGGSDEGDLSEDEESDYEADRLAADMVVDDDDDENEADEGEGGEGGGRRRRKRAVGPSLKELLEGADPPSADPHPSIVWGGSYLWVRRLCEAGPSHCVLRMRLPMCS